MLKKCRINKSVLVLGLTVFYFVAQILGIGGFTLTASAATVNFIGSAEPPEHKLALWYTRPATDWETEALPIGNGYLGGMVFGGVDQEHIQFNEKTLWEGGPGQLSTYNGGNREGAASYLPAIRQCLAEGNINAAKSLLQNLTGVLQLSGSYQQTEFGAYQSFGDIYLDFNLPSNITVSDYRRELDLEDGICRVSYTYEDVEYVREYFCSYPDNVMVMHLTSDKPGMLNFDLRPTTPHTSANITAQGNSITIRGNLARNKMAFEAQFRIMNEGGQLQAGNGKITVSNADAVTIVMAAGTDYANDYPTYKGEDPHERVETTVNAAVAKSYDELKSTHLNDYQELFGRVSLDLNDSKPQIPTDQLLTTYSQTKDRSLDVLFFQYGRYLLISSSREGSLPANLQGVWNNSLTPPWSSDYHFNINLQMNYWPAEVTNLTECSIPLVDYVESIVEPGRVTAAIHNGITDGGWVVNTMNNPFGFTAPGWDFYWGWAPTANAWICHNLWEKYQFTQNKEYLENKIYPVIKEATQFWTKFLVEDTDGTLVSSPSYSPEQGEVSAGCTFDQELIWQLFTDFIDASEVLGTDEDLRNLVTDMRSRLSPLKIGKYGQIQEWKEDIDDPNNTHRHISHLVGLYPGNHITRLTPEYLEAAKVTLNHRGDAGTGWSKANKINLWARALDGDRAYSIFQGQLTGSTLENLFDTHPPFQIDGNFGATAGVAEMLIQSHLDTIDILPALPSAWSTGRFKGLKARGNFVVDVSWSNMKADIIRITSGSGNTCRVSYPLLSNASVATTEGTPVKKDIIDENTIEFETEAGKTYVISSIPSQLPEKPQNLKTRRTTDNTVELTWDSARYASSYNVYRRTTGDFELIATGVSEPRYADNTAVYIEGVPYHYAITAVNDAGESEMSDEKTEVTFEYLSDLDWVSGTIGWGTIQRDRSNDGNPIRLRGEDGTIITYQKGIGTHANSEIVYNIAGKGYTSFESYVGVDQEGNQYSSITFEVWVDNVRVYDSGLMKVDTPQKFVNIDITGKKEIKLVVTDAGNGISNDHGDWADAIFRTQIQHINVLLSDIKVNSISIENFNPLIDYYEVILPHDSTEVPKVTATAQNTGSDVTIINASQLPGSTTITVTSPDGTKAKTYTIYFKLAADPSAILVAGYDFEDIENPGKDSSSYGNNGTVVGKLTYVTREGSNAAVFNGSTYITVPSSESLELTNEATFDFWINPDGYTNYWQKIIQKINNQTGRGGYLIDLSPQGKLRFHTDDVIANMLSSSTIPIGQWTHVRITFSLERGTVRMYINGVLDKEAYVSGGFTTSQLPLVIGAKPDGGDAFEGKLDNIKIYNKAVEIEDKMEYILDGHDTVAAGDEIVLTIGVNNAKAVIAQDLTLVYNPENIEYIGTESLDERVSVLAEKKDVPGTVRLIVAGKGISNIISGDAELLKVKFKAVREFENETVTLADIKVSDNNGVVTQIKPVSKQIKAYKPALSPDINGDGIVDIRDLGIAAGYYGLDDKSSEWIKASKADFTGDGYIGIDDLIIIVLKIINGA
mgnify:CR=1 FL=1